MVFNANIAVSLLSSSLGGQQQNTNTFSPITINTSTLLAAQSAQANLAAARAAPIQLSGASTADPAASVEVTPPWDADADVVETEDLLNSVLARGSVLNTDTLNGFSNLEAPDSQKQLFALHESLRGLLALAGEAAKDDSDITDSRRRFLDTRFQSGLDEVSTYVGQNPLDDVNILMGKERSTAVGTNPVVTPSEDFITREVWNGAFDAEATTLSSAGPFTISIQPLNGTTVDISVDLSTMTETKNLDNIAAHINGLIEAQGFNTRFSRVKLGEADEDGVIQGDSYGFKIKGDSFETLNFSAPTSSPAVFVGGASGGDASTTSLDQENDIARNGPEAGLLTQITGLTNATPTLGSSQRLEASAGTVTVEKTTFTNDDGTVSDTPITTSEQVDQAAIANIVKTTAGPNGEIFALIEYEGALVDGTTPQGTKDIALARYDSSGRQLWSRALGTAESAEGFSLAVGSNGTVAVGGSVTGAFGQTVDVGGEDAFVASYTSSGDLNFTQRLGTLGDDKVTALAVDDAGMIYAGGSVSGALSGSSFSGQTDGFIRALNTDGTTAWTQTLGTTGVDTVGALAVSGSDLIVGAVQDGSGSVLKYATTDGTQDATYTASLGNLDDGSIAGIAIDDTDGAVYVTGSARSGFTTPGNANAGQRDGYLARITSTADATLEYANFFGGTGEDTVSDIAASGGDVYIVGTTNGTISASASQVGSQDGFLARFTGTTGAEASSVQFSGRGGRAEANGLALVQNGDSALNAFGLPQGELIFTDSREVADRTTAKVGDYFDIRIEGRFTRRITLEEGDTVRALAFKTDLALGTKGDASSSQSNGGSVLRIAPEENVSIEIIAGGEGRDLLAALGMEPGPVLKEPLDLDNPDKIETFGLNLTSSIDLTTQLGAKAAQKTIEEAMSTIRRAYRDISTDPELDALLNSDKPTGSGGTAPEFLNDRIANAQAALARFGLA